MRKTTKTFFTYCAFSTKHLVRKAKHEERPIVSDLMRVFNTPWCRSVSHAVCRRTVVLFLTNGYGFDSRT